ncbi:probable cation-transporting ATPase 13A4 [Erpetoichthys calabaricus]|uniref:Cation-transporting ATPase n=1 Tax=Erpetoichthys calabaricus TaxID=27687 RepID=A0A8C4S393_ERPCA|nr:probable cation-transporting ATPase 13A4 [Erpetoichthys calabaricus]
MGGKENYIDEHCQLINHGEENEMQMFAYKSQRCRQALCIVGGIFTCGFLYLLFYWKPEWNVWANCTPCSLEEADVVLLRTTDDFKSYTRKVVRWVYLSPVSDRERPLFQDQGSVLYKVTMYPELKVRYIEAQKLRYAWDRIECMFVRLGGLDDSLSCKDIHWKYGKGLCEEEENVRRLIVGPNSINIQISPIWKLMFKEILNPFYVFQVFSVCLWFAEDYMTYAIAIIIMSIISISLSVYDVRQQSVKLHKLVAEHNSMNVKVSRMGTGWVEIPSNQMVPGDIFQIIGNKQILSCDAILLSGSCIINESMLTGESVPVTKSALPQESASGPWKDSSPEDYKRHVLYCGTQVIQIKAASGTAVQAVVLRTGFTTAKGELVRSILYPKPTDFKLYRDATRFLMCLIAVALIGMIYSIIIWTINKAFAGDIVMDALDVITIAVPPALPAAMTVGIIYAQGRLKKRGVFCISPQRINVCGQMNLVCFDKTGTLTEDGLDLWALSEAKDHGFAPLLEFHLDAFLPWSPSCAAMATCHSLITIDGNIQGDPLDIKMFEATGWVMNENTEKFQSTQRDPLSLLVKPGPTLRAPVDGILVLQQFPFSSSLQRMSVVTHVLGSDELILYMKGAPEKVASLCQPETVPLSFSSHLAVYTQQGFRVIALAYKSLGSSEDISLRKISRESAEMNLIFLGLLILENRLKVETEPVLLELRNARIRSVMVTGDNLQTAVTVAKNSGMVPKSSKVILVEAAPATASTQAYVSWSLVEEPRQNYGAMESHIIMEPITDYHFAMTGKSYEVLLQHFYHLVPKLLLNGTVFARMAPGQKANLVEEFQKLEYVVGMCGDGANDCGALKMAHAGISLSEQEASVASPFTSNIPNIKCVPLLIREGRAALVTSFCVFKYMALYSMIQYMGVLLLYWELNDFGNYQFLFEDLAITTVIGVTMNLNHAYPKLVSWRPPSQLISPPLLLSVVFNTCLSLALQTFGFVMVQKQEWYSRTNLLSGCPVWNVSNTSSFLSNDGFQSYENTTVWLLSIISCISVAFIFSKGKPFRKPFYTNYIFMLVLLVQLGVCIFFIFADIAGLYYAMDMVCTPLIWRGYIVIMLLVNFLISFFVEEVIVENRALWLWLNQCFGIKSRSRYRVLQRTLEGEPSWPPVAKTEFSHPASLLERDNMVFQNAAFEHSQEEQRPNWQGASTGNAH